MSISLSGFVGPSCCPKPLALAGGAIERRGEIAFGRPSKTKVVLAPRRARGAHGAQSSNQGLPNSRCALREARITSHPRAEPKE
eukprot:5877809-Pyramimonas_sp.AAC.1